MTSKKLVPNKPPYVCPMLPKHAHFEELCTAWAAVLAYSNLGQSLTQCTPYKPTDAYALTIHIHLRFGETDEHYDMFQEEHNSWVKDLKKKKERDAHYSWNGDTWDWLQKWCTDLQALNLPSSIVRPSKLITVPKKSAKKVKRG